MKKGTSIQLEDACNIEYGTRVVRKRDGGKGYPVYGGGGATFEMDRFNREDRLVIARFGMSEECTRFVEGKFYLNDSGLTVSPKNESMHQRFLDYQMLSLNDEIYALGKGTAQKNLDVPVFRTLPLFAPPLPEQQRIVRILDEAFESIAKARDNAEKNLRNAREVFESHLNEVFTRKGEGWGESKLESITTKIGSGATPRGGEDSYKTEGVSLIRSLNVHDLGFKYNKLAFLDDSQANGLSNVEVQPLDVLLNITGASIARCCIVPDDVIPARVNQHVSIIRPISDILHPDFLHYMLISKPYKEQLLQTGEGGGSTRQAITKAQIREFIVAFPAQVKAQKAISTALDKVSAETQRLAAICEQKLTALDELKQSLLRQAFNGDL